MNARPTRKGSSPLVIALAVIVPSALVLAFVLVTRGGDSSPQIAAGNEPGVTHVHGLGINPADGELHVATHNGTFRIPEEGPAERVGDSYQDTMGFTVAGPDQFYGSGHPDVADMREGQPGLLGLIESTDAGETWESVSLSGEVDFHSLAFAHDKLYGLDATSGRFMVSDDAETWDTRSTVDLFSFAVDPDDRDQIIGTSPEGLIDSDDGGRTWTTVEGPDIVFLSWERSTGLWGVSANGNVHRSSSGRSWEQVGSLPGPPQALLAYEDVLYAAAQEGELTGIYRSDDEGDSWQLQYRDER
jgi:photosystem II stability/assembly factor-like uncharacterized protein